MNIRWLLARHAVRSISRAAMTVAMSRMCRSRLYRENEIRFFDICKETATMKFGVHGINIGHYGTGEVMAEVAQAMEGAGFESLWVAEHVVLPDSGFFI